LIVNDGWSGAHALTDEFQTIKKQCEKNCYE